MLFLVAGFVQLLSGHTATWFCWQWRLERETVCVVRWVCKEKKGNNATRTYVFGVVTRTCWWEKKETRQMTRKRACVMTGACRGKKDGRHRTQRVRRACSSRLFRHVRQRWWHLYCLTNWQLADLADFPFTLQPHTYLVVGASSVRSPPSLFRFQSLSPFPHRILLHGTCHYV